MDAPIITYDAARPALRWTDAMDSLRQGHLLPRASVGDLFLGPAGGTLLTRAAHVEGLGYGVKSVTVFGENPARGLPSVQGAMFVFNPDDGRLEAIVESRLVTEIKTAADSILGARLLARPDPEELLIVGAGTVARSLIGAYCAAFPSLRRIRIWARRGEQAEALARETTSDVTVEPAPDLAEAAGSADIVSTATMAREPVLKGEWIAPGTHVDLIGAFTAEMREADDALISKGALFVDARESTVGHIGELMNPLRRGVISEGDVRGDFYDLIGANAPGRRSDEEITVFKNGGGAHLDLMIARYIVSAS